MLDTAPINAVNSEPLPDSAKETAMIYPRRECITCGTRFTPSHEQELECGECSVWQRDFSTWGPAESSNGLAERGRGDSAHNGERSLDNYRAVARLKPRS